jgi:putative phosphoesterase
MAGRMVIGIVSDTHGLLRPQAVEQLRGVDHIIHAGDIGSPEVLSALREVAPVTAVRGNNDRGAWSQGIPATAVLQAAGAAIYVLHDIHDLDIDPSAMGMAAVVSGHSHKPLVKTEKKVLYLNPGSIGPRRFRLPVAMGRLIASAGRVEAEIIHLPIE